MYIATLVSDSIAVYEVVDNSIDEALAGYCDHRGYHQRGQLITVQDNGRGIPVDFHEKEQKSAPKLL